MADPEVTCNTKQNVNSPHEHISHLVKPANQCRWTRNRVIASINTETNSLYVIDPVNGARANIGAVCESDRAPYFRTYTDGQWYNNFLSLNQLSARLGTE